jgi:Na+/melibiose symporter-like transporter
LDAPQYVRAQQRDGKLPTSTKLFQGIGALPDTFMTFALNTFLLFYYNQVLGIRAVLASAAIMLALVIDALADPIVGSYSDNLRSRLGRRHPLMYASAVPLGLALYFVFAPPAGLSEMALFAWLTTFAVATRLSMTFFLVPWSALFAEFSDDYAERSAIVTYRFMCAWIGGIVFAFSSFTFIFPSTPEFTPGQLNPNAYHVFAWILGGLVAGFALLTTYLTRNEVPYLLQPAGAPPSFSLKHVLGEVAMALKNRDFLVLFTALLIASAVGGTVEALGIYMNTYFWGFTPENLRWFVIAFVGSVTAFLLMAPLQRRFDKKQLLITCLLFNLANGMVVVGLRFLDVLPANGDPMLLYVLIANEVLRVGVATVAGVMFVSMVADALDAQELTTGRRQEGVFSAALSFSSKATSGFGVLLGGVILDYAVHFPRGVAPNLVEHGLLTQLGIIAGLVLPVLFLFPFWLVSRYRITRDAHAEVRRQLQLRHGVANGTNEG